MIASTKILSTMQIYSKIQISTAVMCYLQCCYIMSKYIYWFNVCKVFSPQTCLLSFRCIFSKLFVVFSFNFCNTERFSYCLPPSAFHVVRPLWLCHFSSTVLFLVSSFSSSFLSLYTFLILILLASFLYNDSKQIFCCCSIAVGFAGVVVFSYVTVSHSSHLL